MVCAVCGSQAKWSMLHTAAFRGHYEVARLLLLAGASRTAQLPVLKEWNQQSSRSVPRYKC